MQTLDEKARRNAAIADALRRRPVADVMRQYGLSRSQVYRIGKSQAERFASAGAKVTEVRLPPEFATLHAAGQRVLEAEAAAYHRETFAAHEKDYGPAIAETIRVGLGHTAVDYVAANRARLAFREAVMPLLATHDGNLNAVARAMQKDRRQVFRWVKRFGLR